MSYHLVVRTPFHDASGKIMKVGDPITDAEKVKEILESHRSGFVTKVPDTVEWDKEEKPAENPGEKVS